MDPKEQVQRLFEQGEKLIDISNKLNINYNTVKQWRNRGKWKKPKKVTKKVTSKSDSKEPSKVEKEHEQENDRLTEKQKLFCLYFVNNRNATQAYLKAHNCNYAVAGVEGYRNLRKPKIKEEIKRLKDLKKDSIMISEEDIVERYMRIAFADITDFTEFGTEEVPVMTKEGPVMITNPDTGKEEFMMQSINVVKFKNSNQVDGGLICEIKTSRQGASLKLEDRQKALDWLADYFEINPEHIYKKEHDEKKLQIERERLQHTKEIDKLKVF